MNGKFLKNFLESLFDIIKRNEPCLKICTPAVDGGSTSTGLGKEKRQNKMNRRILILLIVFWGIFCGGLKIQETQAAAPSVISKGTASAGTATSVTPSYPASPQANDIIFILAISHQPNGIGVIDLPSGFTEAAQGTYQNSSLVDQGRAALFWKRAIGGESGTVTISRTGDTGLTDTCFFAQMYLVRGAVTSGDPWDDITARYGPGNATVTWDAVTVSGSERTLLAPVAQADNASTVDPPSGYSGLATDTTATGTDAELRLLYKENVSSDGQVTATGGETEGWATFHISVKPPSPAITITSSTNQPSAVLLDTTHNVMGSVSVAHSVSTDTVTAVTLKENGGTVDAQNELANVELWLSSDDTWDSGDNRLDVAKSFDGTDGECTFTEAFQVGTTTQYLIVRLDVLSSATTGHTIEIQVSTVTASDPVNGIPCDIIGTTTVNLPSITVASSIAQPLHAAAGCTDKVMGLASIVRDGGTGQVTAVP